MFEKRIEEAAAQAVEEALLANAIEQGRLDIASGRFLTGDDAWAAIEKRANADA